MLTIAAGQEVVPAQEMQMAKTVEHLAYSVNQLLYYQPLVAGLAYSVAVVLAVLVVLVTGVVLVVLVVTALRRSRRRRRRRWRVFWQWR